MSCVWSDQHLHSYIYLILLKSIKPWSTHLVKRAKLQPNICPICNILSLLFFNGSAFFISRFLRYYTSTKYFIFTIHVSTKGNVQILCRVHHGLSSMVSVWSVVLLYFLKHNSGQLFFLLYVLASLPVEYMPSPSDILWKDSFHCYQSWSHLWL